MEPKLDQFSYPTYEDLWDYHIDYIVTGKEKEIPLRYKFLFCNGALSYDNKGEVDVRCCKPLEYLGILTRDGKLLQIQYICKNCKYQARMKAQKIAAQQKWTGSEHRTLTFKDYEFKEYGKEIVAGVMFIKIPFGSVYRIVEVVEGPNCFSTTDVLTGDEKTRYYLRGLVPDKYLKVK